MRDSSAWRKILLPVVFLTLILITGCRGCDHDSNVVAIAVPGVKPVVDSVVPLDGSTGVALNSNVSVIFSKQMSENNASSAFVLETAGVRVAGLVTFAGLSGKFDPAEDLLPGTLYRARLTTGITDKEGNSLAEDFTWSFTTGLEADLINPRVVSTNPADGETGVAVNKVISVPFSEILDPLTVNASTFILTGPTGIVPGTVSVVGVTAIFKPSAILTEGAVYTVRLTDEITDLAGNNLLFDYVWSFTGVPPEAVRPTVVSTDPAAGDTGVAINKKIAVLFSEEMNPLSITVSTFRIKDSTGNSVAGLITYTGLTAEFAPFSQLANGQTYNIEVTTGASDLAGNALQTAFSWSFTTGVAPDNLSPAVISTDPVAGAENVPTSQRIAATFSEGMNAASINTSSFTVSKADGTQVAGTVTLGGVVSGFVPAASLEFNTVYTATINTTVMDLAGNRLLTSYVWSFTTGSAVDNTAPEVVFTDPANASTGVATSRKIAVSFSESMNPATLNTRTFAVSGPGSTAVPGTVNYANMVAYFTPTGNLQNDVVYTGVISSGAKDLSGNALTRYSWVFTTGSAADTTPPEVVSAEPAADERNVPFNKTIALTFSEGMNLATINASTFKVLRADGVGVAGAISCTGINAYFNPVVDLAPDATYSATITTGARDLAGNALAADYTWEFVTGAAPDTTLPTITAVSPANGSLNVQASTMIVASFSENMDAATIKNSTFTVTKPDGTLIAGTVTCTGRLARFTPTELLAAGAQYTIRITTGVRDLAGNSLAAIYTWRFTTALPPDLTRPAVVTTDPADGATNTPFNKTIAVIFSETMKSETVNVATFIVRRQIDGAVITGSVACDGLTANFNPAVDLAADATYTVTITDQAVDLAGNALTGKVWSFKTGAIPDTTGGTVVLIDPSDSAVDVPFNKTVSAVFSESMNPATIDASTFTLQKQADMTPVTGVVSYDGLVARFNPATDLTADTVYTATISNLVEDLAGNLMIVSFTWNFKTGAAADNTAPFITTTDPANNAVNVAFNQTLSGIFSETVIPSTLNDSTFTLVKLPGGAPIAGTVTCDGLTAIFNPDVDLDPDSDYRAGISSGVTDLAGNAMVAKSWVFRTGIAPDNTLPVVSSTDPISNAVNVAFNKTITAVFSEGMNPSTINPTSFTVVKQLDGSPVAGIVSYNGLSASFDPDGVLEAAATYTARIASAACDLAGNFLVAYEWSFSTGIAPDTTPPAGVSTDPLNNATNVAFDKTVTVTFSETMNSATLNSTSFSLVRQVDGLPVAGVVTYNGLVASFNPDNDLTPAATYTATVSTAAQDPAGNGIVANLVWSFSTGPAPDTTAPTVVSTDPLHNAQDVPFNITVTAAFSESLNPLTLSSATFFLVRQIDGISVVGETTCDGLSASFNPLVDLAPDATFTATIRGAEDTAGNEIVEKVWSFKTRVAPDTLQPTVVSTNPAIGMTDVPVNQEIRAVFSEAMDPATIGDESFSIAGVAGTVVFEPLTRTIVFKPAVSLAINTDYTATIASSVKDLAGNSLNGNTFAEDHVWTFTTGLRTLASPVALGEAATFGNFGGNAGITNSGILTVVNGDIGTTAASTLITGFHDSGGRVYTETTLNQGLVTGVIYTATAPPGSTDGEKSSSVELDAGLAYSRLTPALLPGGIDVANYGGSAGELGNRVLKPGIYKSAPGSFKIQGGPLTLDAQGDANAVWVFQMSSSLTVGGPGAALPQSVLLINNAQAKNVFWQVGSAATINAGGGGTMTGTIISQAGATFSTAGNVEIVTLNGRALSLGASITLVNTVINLPEE